MHKLIFFLLFPFLVFANQKTDLLVQPKEEEFFGDNQVNPTIAKIYFKEIAAVERYLNSYYTYSASFKQSNMSGQISYGKLFISKAEKIRCEYNNPTPLLLIMNGDKITYYDKELDEVSHANSDINALKILSMERIKFDKFKLAHAEKEPGFVSFTFTEKSKELKQDMAITMRFTYPQVNLKEVVILTEDNQVNMIFDKPVYNQPLSKELFYFNRVKNNKNK